MIRFACSTAAFATLVFATSFPMCLSAKAAPVDPSASQIAGPVVGKAVGERRPIVSAMPEGRIARRPQSEDDSESENAASAVRRAFDYLGQDVSAAAGWKQATTRSPQTKGGDLGFDASRLEFDMAWSRLRQGTAFSVARMTGDEEGFALEGVVLANEDGTMTAGRISGPWRSLCALVGLIATGSVERPCSGDGPDESALSPADGAVLLLEGVEFSTSWSRGDLEDGYGGPDRSFSSTSSARRITVTGLSAEGFVALDIEGVRAEASFGARAAASIDSISLSGSAAAGIFGAEAFTPLRPRAILSSLVNPVAGGKSQVFALELQGLAFSAARGPRNGSTSADRQGAEQAGQVPVRANISHAWFNFKGLGKGLRLRAGVNGDLSANMFLGTPLGEAVVERAGGPSVTLGFTVDFDGAALESATLTGEAGPGRRIIMPRLLVSADGFGSISASLDIDAKFNHVEAEPTGRDGPKTAVKDASGFSLRTALLGSAIRVATLDIVDEGALALWRTLTGAGLADTLEERAAASAGGGIAGMLGTVFGSPGEGRPGEGQDEPRDNRQSLGEAGGVVKTLLLGQAAAVARVIEKKGAASLSVEYGDPVSAATAGLDFVGSLR